MRYATARALNETDPAKKQAHTKVRTILPLSSKSNRLSKRGEKLDKSVVKYITETAPMPFNAHSIIMTQKMKRLVQNWERFAFEGIG